MDFTTVTKGGGKGVCSKNQAHKAIQGSPICLTDSDHDFILDKIKLIDTIANERKINGDERCEWIKLVYGVLMLFIIISINFIKTLI